MRGFVVTALLAASVTGAFAQYRPELPPSAKKLAKDQILAMMDGKTFKYKSFNHDKLMTGKTKFDFKKGLYSGTYDGKPYSPQPLSISSQAYCYDKTCPEGGNTLVYADGATIYEVSDGKVGEVLSK